MAKDNLVHFFADKVIGRNQHVVITIYGGAGTGKSELASGLVIGLANYMGARLNRHPTTLFNFRENLACINLDRVQSIMEDPAEYAIKWLDDIGTAVNSRTFAKKGNIDFNDILQTFRPNKNIVVITTQYDFLIDKVPRKLAHFHIEMTHKLFETHNVPLTASKVSQIQYKMRTGETWYPFIQDEYGRYVQYINYHVPEEFSNEYEKIRRIEYKRMLQLKKEAREEKVKAPSKKERILELRRDYDANVDECQKKHPDKGRGIPQSYWLSKGIDPGYASNIRY